MPSETFEDFRSQLAADRAQFYLDVPPGPFYGFQPAADQVVGGDDPQLVAAGMMGGAIAHYDGIKAFKTDQTADLRAITVPTLIQQGDDQVVPY